MAHPDRGHENQFIRNYAATIDHIKSTLNHPDIGPLGIAAAEADIERFEQCIRHIKFNKLMNRQK